MRRMTLLLAVMATVLGLSAAPALAAGATQVSGEIGAVECDDLGADYVIPIVGDLEGCIHGWVTSYQAQPGGTYKEIADELFVGSWGGLEGTFEMTETLIAKFDGEPFASPQEHGRCKHPIVAGSGTGDFAGITGRLDFKDDVEVGTAYYTGHLKLGS